MGNIVTDDVLMDDIEDELAAILTYAEIKLDENTCGPLCRLMLDRDSAMDLCKEMVDQFRGIIKTIEAGYKKNEECLEKELENAKNELFEVKRERRHNKSACEELEFDGCRGEYSPCDECSIDVYAKCVFCQYSHD